MDFNIEIRKKQLESIDQFISSSRAKLQSVVDYLGWSVDKIEEERLMVNCPYNATHTVPAEKIDDHLKICEIKSTGYKLDESFLSEPVNCTPEGSIKLDTAKKSEVLSYALTQTPYFRTAWNGQDPDPRTHSRLLTTFSRDERLALYDYSVSNTKGPEALTEFNTSATKQEDGTNVYTTEALRSFERDIKRRSVKYKPVHTNHKNYKEVLREVINSQMQQYSDWITSNNTVKGPHTPESTSNEEPGKNLEEHDSRDKTNDYTDRPQSSISKASNNSSSSHGAINRRERSSESSQYRSRKWEQVYHRRDDDLRHSKYSSKSNHRHRYYNEDNAQDAHYKNSVKTEITDSPNRLSDNISRNTSRESSLYSSQESRSKGDGYKEKSYKLRSPSRDRKTKKHYKQRSRSRHRSKERKRKRSSFRN